MSTSPIGNSSAFSSPYSSGADGSSVPSVPDSRDAPAAARGGGSARRDSVGQSIPHGVAAAHPLLRQYSAAKQPSASRQSYPASATQFAAAMIARYDGGTQSRNEAADRNNTLLMLQTAKLSMTGLPPDQVEMNLNELQFAGALAQMSEAKRSLFAQRANALRTAPDHRYEAMLSALQQDVQSELRGIQADPVRRMNAVFNPPAGLALLGGNGQQQMAALRSEAMKMNAAGASPAQREQAFARASEIRSRMQTQILQQSQDIHAAQQKSWADSAARVNRILDDAPKYAADTIQLPHNSDDPDWDTNTRKPAYAKTFPYQSVMEKLLSPDGYSQQERGRSTPRTLPAGDRARDLLTFQEGMSDPGSDIYRRVTKLEQQALTTMAAPGPELDAGRPASTLSGVAAHAPAYDQNYVSNLAAGYQGVLKDTDQQNRAMLREHTPGLADKVLYGIGRFAADLSPIPGMDWLATQLLDAGFPDHGGLSGDEVKNIDLGAMIFGLLLGGREPEGEGALKAPVAGPGEGPGRGMGNTPQGQPTQTGVAASRAFTPAGLPEGYALQGIPSSYGPSATPGVHVDAASGQKFIIADRQAFAVRYDRDNATYRIYDPANPTRPAYPVRFDTQTAKWAIHQDVGLQGGMDNGNTSSSGSGPSAASSELPPFAAAFHVTTSTGSEPSAAMMETLNPDEWHSAASGELDNPAYVNQYKSAFDALPAAQRRAIREWTHLDIGGDSDRYSSDSSYEGNNFELNQQLYRRVHDADTAVNARRLQEGIDHLPKPQEPNRLLRIAEVPADYASRFAPGEYVTNSPAFMSASSENEYANATLRDGPGGSGPDHPFALYDIAAQSATPFIKSITTLASEESEWLFRPNSLFRIEEIARATPTDAEDAARIGMRLVEVPITAPVYAKNIHSGEWELVYPPGMRPVYTELRSTRHPPLQPPAPRHPDSPPAPTAGNPNATGPSRV